MPKKKDILNYQPKDPHDPKIPYLGDEPKVEEVKEEVEFETTENKMPKALQILMSKQTLTENSTVEYEPSGEVVLPDPNSDMRIKGSHFQHVQERVQKHSEEIGNKISHLKLQQRANLNEKDINKIVKEFKEAVVAVKKTEVVLKLKKYGYEIYYNNADNRYWVTAVKFTEPFNPKKLVYITLWSGASFVGYGFKTLDEVIQKTKDLTTRGTTGNVIWRDYCIDIDFEHNRIIASREPREFSYPEYAKILKWYDSNKLWIMIKQAGSKDAEDVMIENRNRRKQGLEVDPLSHLQLKMMDKPRKLSNISAYPVKDSKYKGKEYVKAENKKYVIGFTYSD